MTEARQRYKRLLHPGSRSSGRQAAASNSVIYLANAKYLLLDSERMDGTAVGTPMWFAVVDDTIFLRTEAESPEVSRIQRRPRVTVATCTMRGVPFGDYIECSARIVPPESDAEAEAEAALRRTYGTMRRLLNTLARSDHVYLEVTPVAPKLTPTLEVVSLPPRATLVPNAREDDIPPGAA